MSKAKKAETVLETENRVETPFLRDAVTSFQRWADGIDGLAMTHRGYGSERNIHYRGAKWVGFYFARRWIYMELWHQTDEEMERLRRDLSRPDTVMERGRPQRTCRFRVFNERDLDAVKRLLLARIDRAKGAM